MNAMFAKLLRKDLHINRALLLVAVLGLVLPYVLGSLINWYRLYRYNEGQLWSILLAYAGLWGSGLSILTVTLLSANAVAGERAERSAEFLACVPVSRRAILASKALVALGATVVIWLVNVGVVYGLTSRFPPVEPRDMWRSDYRHAPRMEQADVLRARDDVVPVLAFTALLAWGMAWGCSSLVRSPVLAAGAGVGTPFVIFMLLAIVASSLPGAAYRLGPWYAVICIILGVAGCAGGTWYYLRRVEP